MKNDEKVPLSWALSKLSYEFNQFTIISSLFSIPVTLLYIKLIRKLLEEEKHEKR